MNASGCSPCWSLGSSIWQSQPQTTAAHTSYLRHERIIFAAVPAFQGKCLFLCSPDKATAEGSRTRLGKEVQCLAAWNSVPHTSSKLKQCKILVDSASSHATVWGEQSLSCNHLFPALSVSKEGHSPFHRISLSWKGPIEFSSWLCTEQPQLHTFVIYECLCRL